MSEESAVRDLFDRWERVWHEGRYELIPDCVEPNYIRHDEAGDRTVTRGLRSGGCQHSPTAAALAIRCVRSHIQWRPRLVPLYAQVDRSDYRRAAHASGHAGLPDRGWQARGNVASVSNTRLGMDRCRRAGSLDESACVSAGSAHPLNRFNTLIAHYPNVQTD
jgi:hypothetical protein